MSVVVVLVALAILYLVGFRGWSRMLAERVLGVSASERTPAHDPELRDDIDYLPVNRHILWGHHYTSIAGAAPIIGPAVAVIWGWVPALVWVVFGTIFIGAAHDFGALVLSARHDGRTMGDLAGDVVHPRVRVLFQIIVYFLVWIVLAVFAFAIGMLFDRYPATVIPVNFQIIVAMVIGWLFHSGKVKILAPSIIALVLLYAMVAVGIEAPVSLSGLAGDGGDTVVIWAVILLVYSAIASVLPVWLLLQPRDYINSHQLIVGLGGLVLGLAVLRPEITAEAFDPSPPGAPPIFPILFVTIACGAISGFHGLVSSGTTSKQLDRMTDARPIGYGGMLGEATLAVIATMAVAAGLDDWHAHYHSWNESGINAIANFVEGGGTFLGALGLTESWAEAIVAVLAICFAATSMDTGARIQRMVVTELGRACGVRALRNRYLATIVAVGPAVPLVLAGPAVWGPLWLLFGTTNQLIGAMTLLILFVYLFRSRRPLWQYAAPMIFLVTMTTGAMVVSLLRWIASQETETPVSLVTIVLGALILVLEAWMVIEAVIIVLRLRRQRAVESDG